MAASVMLAIFGERKKKKVLERMYEQERRGYETFFYILFGKWRWRMMSQRKKEKKETTLGFLYKRA